MSVQYKVMTQFKNSSRADSERENVLVFTGYNMKYFDPGFCLNYSHYELSSLEPIPFNCLSKFDFFKNFILLVHLSLLNYLNVPDTFSLKTHYVVPF